MNQRKKLTSVAGTIAVGLVGAALVNSCTSLHDHPMFQGPPGAATSKNELPKLYTEAYIEFAGPADRWAGPPTWIVHVKATNPPEITITPALEYEAHPATPAVLATQEAPATVGRAPAGTLAIASAPAGTLAIASAPASSSAIASTNPGGKDRVPAGMAAVVPLGTTNAVAPAIAESAPEPTALTADLVRARLAQLDQWTTPQPLSNGGADFHSCLSPVRVKLVRSDGVVTERRGCRVQSAWSTQVSSMASELTAYAVASAQHRNQ